jgi:hypothetical protein
MYKKLLFNLFIVLTTSSIVGAKIYLWEDFEGFTPGESLDTTGVWVQQGTSPLGIASDVLSYPSGGISGYFEEMAGIRHVISEGELPSEFFISAWYYHDASGPPPHYMLVFRGPAGSDWLGVGTVETIENYSIRDKRGTGQETDTGVSRKNWVNIVWQVTQDGTEVFLDGHSVYTSVIPGDTWRTPGSFIWFANVWADSGYAYLDNIGIADTLEEIGKSNEIALNPTPADGELIEGTWANLSWSPGDFAVSHDIYIGDNFDDVDSGVEDTYVGNQADTFIVVGFPGFAFPDGLVPGTTYYWRIDEVNEVEPNSPWKGEIWSFSIPPKTAYFPVPDDAAEAVSVDVELSWTGGYGSKLHTVYFGETYEEVENATGGQTQGSTTYTPGTLKMAKIYYWRVDEFDIIETHKGDVWSFTTEGAVAALEPINGAVDVTQTPILTWAPGFGASHEIYFGTNPVALELKGSGNLGSESFEPGKLEWNTTYYWRIDEANNANVDSPWTGPLWSFTTANFLIIDDMESYNDIAEGEEGSNRIYLAWLDGYDNPAINGSVVGNDPPPIAELTIVHSGNQSMPMIYDNAVGKSEATLTLTSNNDWTVNGVNTLRIWFRGEAGNAAEQVYVALNGNARVDHDDPDAATLTSWTEWNIPLQAFADQGVNLSNVNSITLGLSSVTGGTGKMYFDDIRLYPPAP